MRSRISREDWSVEPNRADVGAIVGENGDAERVYEIKELLKVEGDGQECVPSPYDIGVVT